MFLRSVSPLAVALTAMLVFPAAAIAQDETPKAPVDPSAEGHGYLSVQVENDMFGNGADRHYTHGTEFSYVSEPCAFRWVSRTAEAIYLLTRAKRACSRDRVSFSLGQAIFTPADISSPTPDPTDRPYAGWLYLSSGILSEDFDGWDPLAADKKVFRGLKKLEVSLGVVGPAAGAGFIQRNYHELIGAREPMGWSHQLSNEPALMVSYEYQWRYGYHVFPGLEFDATPHAGMSLGNVFTQGALGFTVRIGHNMLLDYGPARIRPSTPGAAFFQAHDGLGWYLFAGTEGRAVARNIFLDGNSFADSPSVDKRSFVGDVQFGFALTYGGARLAFTHVYRTKEFFGQPYADEFGAISLSVGL